MVGFQIIIQIFKKNFSEKYPYSNRTSWSKQFIGSVVFSKVPITNWADDFHKELGDMVILFSVNYQGTPIYFYLVHMSSPSSPAHFEMRNQQIDRFSKTLIYISVHRSRNDKVVVFG